MKLSRKAVVFASLLGFVAQVANISRRYFLFETTTLVKFASSNHLRQCNLAFCTRYSDVLDVRRLQRTTGIRIGPLNSMEDRIRNLEGKLTPAQVFAHTLPSNQTLSSCIFRPDPWTLIEGNASVCADEFAVGKFFMQEFVCYTFTPRIKRRLSLLSATRSAY